MTLQPFSDEQLNFFKFSSLVLDEFPKALRQTFKTMWDNTYGGRPGFQLWDDSAAVRNLFATTEGGRTKVPIHQSYNGWDCTNLFQATIFSRSFALPAGTGSYHTLSDLYVKPRAIPLGSFHACVLSPSGNKAETFALAIDQLRRLRNELFSSLSSEMDKLTFDQCANYAKDAFQALGLSTAPIDSVGSLTESDELKEGQRGRDAQSKNSGTKPFFSNATLPYVVPYFTGRQSECADIIRHVTSESTRLVSICGSPGFGKTSVAIAVAHALQYQGIPVYWISLRGLHSKADLTSKFLSSLRQPTTHTKLPDQRLSIDDWICLLFSEISKPSVVILDNADDLLETDRQFREEVIQLFGEILRRNQKVTFVLTARESLDYMDLNFQGHWELRIKPLDEASAQTLVSELLPNAGVADSTQISRICGQVPFAMKLMCSLVSEEDNVQPRHFLDVFMTSSTGSLVEMLDNPNYPATNRLQFLFDSSFQRLTVHEQEALVSLSILPANFSIEVAAAVLGKTGTLKAMKILRSLRRKSLIDSSSKPGVFTMHKLLQSFARDKGEQEMTETILESRGRLQAFYISILEKLNEQFLSGHSMAAYIAFYEDKEKIIESLVEGCSDFKTADSVFDILVRGEMFLESLFRSPSDKKIFDYIYDVAITAATEFKKEKYLSQLLTALAYKELPYGTEDAVPAEIKARGPRAKRAYENALKKGKVKLYRARLMLMGKDRAGKTSLKKSFLGLPFDPHEDSTDGIQVDPSKFEVKVDQVENWKLTNENLGVSQFMFDLATMVAKELIQDDGDKEEDDRGGDEKVDDNDVKEEEEKEVKEDGKEKGAPGDLWRIFSEGTSKIDNEVTKTDVPAELNIDSTLPQEELTDHLVQRLKSLNIQSDASTVESHMTLDLWDFAGQHLYYASYPVFLSTRAVYMVVYDLSKGLKDIAKPCFKQGTLKRHLSNQNKETNLDNLLSWLVSVNTMCSLKPEVNDEKKREKNLPHCRPPVFIVGTHADESHQDIKEVELQIQQEILGKDYVGHVIRPFFSVDNTQGSADKGVVALQKRLIDILKEEPYMGEEVPIRWFNFEKVVKALIAEKVYYLNIEQLQDIIQKVCFIEDKDEVATMLDFYHDLGVIVRHRNTVILRAQWLIEVFRQLITIRSFNEMEPRHSQLWKEMENTGSLHMELVDHVFSKCCQQQGLIKEDILNMMEQFGLIVKFITSPTNEMYFVPCQLKTPPEDLCEMEPSLSDPCPLYLHFSGGFVPHGFFWQLVSRITKWCTKSGFKQPPRFFLAASRFVIEKSSIHQLILLRKKRFIKVTLTHSEPVHGASLNEVREVAILVRTLLEDTVQDLRRELPWLSNLKCAFCVVCPGCQQKEEVCSNHDAVSCDHEDCLCLLKTLEEGQLRPCSNSLCVKVPTVIGLEKWFALKVIRPGYHPGTDDVYNMTAHPRGRTLIINNTSFGDHDPVLSARHGSEEDVRQVETLFTALDFTVRTKENLTRLELLNELDKVACQDHSAYDCFVLWLMSHGRSGEVFCSDGNTIPIQTLHDMFSNCDTLSGKPKLFFIQACRGDGEDEGVSVAAETGIVSHELLSPNQVDSPIDVVKKPASKVPTHADFLYAFSTVDAYVSYRNKDLGSLYVRGLVKAFHERAVCDHLLDILTVVNQKVSNMEAERPSGKNGNEIKLCKQMPEVKHTLRKKVRF